MHRLTLIVQDKFLTILHLIRDNENYLIQVISQTHWGGLCGVSSPVFVLSDRHHLEERVQCNRCPVEVGEVFFV